MVLKAGSCYTSITKLDLCKTASFISAKVSPNGKLIAQIGADENGISNAIVYPTDKDQQSAKKLTAFTKPDIIQFFWSPNSDKLLILKDENGTGNLKLYGYDIETQKEYAYTQDFERVVTKVVKVASQGNRIAVGLNNRNPKFHDLYILNLDTGNLDLLFQNDEFSKFLLNDDLEIVLKVKIEQDGCWTILTKDDRKFIDLNPQDAFQTELLSYNSENNSVYFLDNRYTNTNALTEKKLSDSFEEQLLGSQSLSDVDEVLFMNSKPRAYASYYTQKKWHPLDEFIRHSISFLEKEVGPNFTVVNQSNDSKFWIVSNSIPDKGSYYWIFNSEKLSLSRLSPIENSDSPKKPFAKMYEMVATSRDGMPLICYYSLPIESDLGGYVKDPIPLVVVPHGGPFKVRDKYEFNAFHQWLASRGYAVLSVNFRLSSGFGKDFVSAGNGEWGRKAHLDIIDAVEQCVSQGIADKSKLAVFGGSYGGYEALAALTFTPEYFTCAVDICGPSNLKTVLKTVPEFWEFTVSPLSDKLAFFTKQAFIASMGGNPEDEAGSAHLNRCSPLNYIHQIKKPLLIIHGKNDHVVSENESRQIYEDMKKHNCDVTYASFSGEGHRFSQLSNKIMYLDQAEKFLSNHLKGKYTPADKNLLDEATGEILN
ncbi:MAG: Dipeptidyl aminopeptidase BIII [Chlamydiae bacterium]|nr:Dipeptidyl aminopeptidase BIII [Chlamydiota bacterium]